MPAELLVQLIHCSLAQVPSTHVIDKLHTMSVPVRVIVSHQDETILLVSNEVFNETSQDVPHPRTKHSQ